MGTPNRPEPAQGADDVRAWAICIGATALDWNGAGDWATESRKVIDALLDAGWCISPPPRGDAARTLAERPDAIVEAAHNDGSEAP